MRHVNIPGLAIVRKAEHYVVLLAPPASGDCLRLAVHSLGHSRGASKRDQGGDSGRGNVHLHFRPGQGLRPNAPRGCPALAGGSARWSCARLAHRNVRSNDDPQYLPCGDKTPAAPNFLRNAEVNIARNTKRAGEIEASRPPPELQSIKTYLLRLATFSAGFERGRAEFARSGDLTNLIAITQSIAGTSCDKVIGGIEGTELRVTQWAEISDKAWNCAMSAFRKRFGEYPDSAWYSFLESRGVKAKFNSAMRN